MRAFLFPGQGSQYPLMGKALYLAYTEFKGVFHEISEITKIDLKKIIFDTFESESYLLSTEKVQILIFSVSLGILEILKKHSVHASIFLGHSLGEISSYVAAGILSLQDASIIVLKRSQLMHHADPKNRGAMLACIGADLDIIEKLVPEFITEKNQSIFIANINHANQIILSGYKEDLEDFIQYVEKYKKNIRFIFLKVKGAFHCPYLKEVSKKFLTYIQNINFNTVDKIVYSNFTTNSLANEKSAMIRYYLARQIDHPIYWSKMINKILNMGTTECIEVGPNQVLKRIMRFINPKIPVFESDSPEAIHHILNNIEI